MAGGGRRFDASGEAGDSAQGIGGGNGAVASRGSVATKAGSLPTHLVNGDFNYPAGSMIGWHATGWAWSDVARQSRAYNYGNSGWKPISSAFDADRFGWDSTQTDPSGGWQGGERRADAVELQRTADMNVYAELAAAQSGTGIYQDIATVPGMKYKWSLRHTSYNSSQEDAMEVMIGAPGREQPQQAVRTASENGNPLTAVGNIISTKTVSPSAATPLTSMVRKWDTYESGESYIVPAGQTTTRFTFKNFSSPGPTAGNDLDDIVFGVEYPIGFDLAGGSGQSSMTAPAGAQVAVQTSGVKPTRPGYSFVGWSLSPQPDAVGKSGYERAKGTLVGSSVTMPEGALTLHAVWVKNPSLCYDTDGFANDPWGKTGCGTHPYGSAGYDFNDWGVVPPDPDGGSTTLWPGHRFSHWDYLTGPKPGGTDTGRKFDKSTPLTDDTYVVAKWDLPASGSTHPNGAPGAAGDWVGSGRYGTDTVSAPAGSLYTRPGYAFNGWNTRADGSGASYAAGARVRLADGVNDLYARWRALPSSVRYDANAGVDGAVGGSTSDTSGGVTDGQVSLAANGFTRKGFEFAGWNTKPDGSGTAYQPGDLYTLPAGGVTLYAQWRPVVSSLPLTGGAGVLLVSGVFALLAAGLAIALGALRRRFI